MLSEPPPSTINYGWDNLFESLAHLTTPFRINHIEALIIGRTTCSCGRGSFSQMLSVTGLRCAIPA